MKLKYEFVVRDVAGQVVALPTGADSAEFNGMIKLNSVGEFIFKMLANETTLDEILEAITKEYGASADEARASVESYIETLRENGLLAE
ncbi:MAG: PqqD family protein [Clostridia bacterium]|nr:PqqD family protein [Clostridia bacterium]